MRNLRWAGLLLAPALLLAFSAQAGAAKSQLNTVKTTSAPIWTLAIDGSRVAYLSGGKIHVWNTATGATSVVRGRYGSPKPGVNDVAAQVAIAGKRVAWIKRLWIGNTEAREKLYTASLAGQVHELKHVYRYARDDLSQTTGGWIAGLVGSGKVLAVSTWKTNHGALGVEQLNLITPTGLLPIASGAGALVPEAADGGHIAVLRSGTDAWPHDSRRALSPAPTVGIYSADGTLLHEVALTPPDPASVGVQVALSGNTLVALRSVLHEPSGPSTVTLEVYDWTTGALEHTWPVAIDHYTGEVSFAVHGDLVAVEGPSRLHLVDLDTGKDVMIAPASHTDSPPAIGPRGLVYSVNPHYNGPGKLVFVPTARLLALAG
jgi:hypothetical protein